MANLPGETGDGRRVVTEGYFEREVHLSRSETATFLRDLADQIERGNEMTLSSTEWEIPFRFRDPIEVEVEYVNQRDCELEIELEFDGDPDGDGLSVE